jgi:hypothetical protein
MMFYDHNTAALALTMAVCLSFLLAFAVIYQLATGVDYDYKMSKRDELDIFVFLKESKPLLDEYYSRQGQKRLQDEAASRGALSGTADARD